MWNDDLSRSNWPTHYQGKVFTANLHGRRINCDRLQRKGAGYTGKHEPDFMKITDPWFRGIEIDYGPNGEVYILDWSDIGGGVTRMTVFIGLQDVFIESSTESYRNLNLAT